MLRQESVISHYRDSLHKAQILQESFDQYHVYNYVYCTCRQALTGSERSKVIRPQIEWRTLKRTLPDARAKTKCASELFVSWNFVLLGRQRRKGGRKTAELRWSRRLCGGNLETFVHSVAYILTVYTLFGPATLMVLALSISRSQPCYSARTIEIKQK